MYKRPFQINAMHSQVTVKKTMHQIMVGFLLLFCNFVTFLMSHHLVLFPNIQYTVFV